MNSNAFFICGCFVKRIESVDLFRLLAILAVIIIHISWFKHDTVQNALNTEQTLYFFFNQLSRFAVPFFFIISGYFWGIKVAQSSEVLKKSLSIAKKLLFLFVTWSIIYLLPLNLGAIYNYGILGPIKVSYWNLIDLLQNPTVILIQGTKVHLWFLMALLNALLISALFIHKKQEKLLVVLALGLYFFGVLAKAYSDTPWGLNFAFDTRNGPFFSTIFFVTGYILSTKNRAGIWFYYGLGVFFIGGIIHYIESRFLWHNYHILPLHEYLVGTYFMGLGVALIALSNKAWLQHKSLSQLGQLTLGIYAVHFIYVDIFKPFDLINDGFLWELFHITIVMMLSIFTTRLLSKYAVTRKLVL